MIMIAIICVVDRSKVLKLGFIHPLIFHVTWKNSHNYHQNLLFCIRLSRNTPTQREKFENLGLKLGNVSSISSINFVSSKNTLNPIVKWNVCQITHWLDADVYISQCHVCALFSSFEMFYSNNQTVYIAANVGSNDTKICGTAKLACCSESEIFFIAAEKYWNVNVWHHVHLLAMTHMHLQPTTICSKPFRNRLGSMIPIWIRKWFRSGHRFRVT